MASKTVCGVLLFDEAIVALGEAIKPYLSEGPIGHFIYCRSATQVGSFMDMVFDASRSGGRIKEDMRVSIPAHFVKFVVSAENDLPIGFGTSDQQSR